MSWLWYVPLVYAAAAFGALPAIVRFTAKVPLRPRFVPAADLPPEAREHFEQTSRLLGGEGFVERATLLQDPPVGNQRMYVRAFRHPESEECAVAVAAYGGGKLYTRHVEYSSRLADGGLFDTGNAASPLVFAPRPKGRVLRLPEITDPLRLLRIHRALLARHPVGATSGGPTTNDPAEQLALSDREVMEDQLQLGYFYVDEANHCYRPTSKGAALMAWKLAWPVSALRRAVARKEREELLRSLGT